MVGVKSFGGVIRLPVMDIIWISSQTTLRTEPEIDPGSAPGARRPRPFAIGQDDDGSKKKKKIQVKTPPNFVSVWNLDQNFEPWAHF